MSDLDARAFTRRGNALVPSDFIADEFLREIPEGREVLVTIRRPRSVQNHRWFFAMLRRVCENTETFRSEDELLDALKLETGHVERRMRLDGSVYLVPKSISFAAMEQGKFRRFVDRCLYLLASALGVDAEALMREVNDSQKRAA